MILVTISVGVLVSEKDGVVDGVVGTHVVPDVEAVGYDEEDGGDAGNFEDGSCKVFGWHGALLEGGVEGSRDDETESTMMVSILL